MQNKKKIYEKLDIDIKEFLTKNGWKVYDFNDQLIYTYLYNAGLLEIPYKPKYLIEKDGKRMWAYYFWKGGYPYWESKFGQVTGFDWEKYKMMEGLTAKTQLPCAVLFDSESEPEIIFRQLDQLPRPKHSRFKKENCKRAYEIYAPLKAQCFKCWLDNPTTYLMCYRQKKKSRTGLAIWDKNQFGHDLVTQPSLI